MTRRFATKLGAAILAAAALASCEQQKFTPPPPPEEEEALPIAIPSDDAAGQPAAPLTAPYNLPAYAPLRDGATIELSQASAPSGEPGGMVTFVVQETPRAAGDFYKTRLRQAFGAVSEAENGPVHVLSAVRPMTNEHVEVSVSPAAQGGTRVSISYVLPAEAAQH